jgi:HEPN domain-containing protein
MNPLTLEWIEKAEGDFATAGRELRARKQPNYDAVCFHAQQSAEKYLKALLQEQGTAVPRTHMLLDLLAICLKINPHLAGL